VKVEVDELVERGSHVSVVEHGERGECSFFPVCADPVLRPERDVALGDVPFEFECLAHLVRAANEVRVVGTRVVLAGLSELLPEGTHQPREPHVVPSGVGMHGEPALTNAELGVTEALPVVEVVRLHRKGAGHVRVAIRKEHFCPRLFLGARVVPVQVLVVEKQWLVEDARALVVAHRRWAIAAADAQRRSEIAVVVEAKLFPRWGLRQAERPGRSRCRRRHRRSRRRAGGRVAGLRGSGHREQHAGKKDGNVEVAH
jgi:hypothetical protein